MCVDAAGPIVTTMRAFIFAVAALLAFAPVANATPQDDQYLAILKERKHRRRSRQAHRLWARRLRQLRNTRTLAGQVEHMQAIGYTENQTKVIIGLGMQAYCPTSCQGP